MTAPGWYHAQGDPPGSTRYWDGIQWIGDPVYEPSAGLPSPGPGIASSGGYTIAGEAAKKQAFPSGLKALAITVSVLKAIPLVILIVVFLVIVVFAANEDNFFNVGSGEVAAALLIGGAIALVAILLLVFQALGAIKERPIMVIVPAAIMAVLDVLSALGAVTGLRSDGGAGGAGLIIAVAIAQVWIVIWAIKTYAASN